MAVDGRAAAQTMIDFRTWRPGYCLEAVWQAYKRHGARTDRAAPTAYVGWQNSGDKHPDDRNPPAGVPVWFGPRRGSDAGDVVISLGDGRVVATDWPRGGVIGVTTIDARQRQIGRPYLGWTGDILGVPILQATAHTPPIPEPTQEDEMTASFINIKGKAGARRGGCYAIMRDNEGNLFARHVGEPLAGAPTAADERSIADLQASIPGLS